MTVHTPPALQGIHWYWQPSTQDSLKPLWVDSADGKARSWRNWYSSNPLRAHYEEASFDLWVTL